MKHLGSLESTQEARVTWAPFVLSKLLRASYLDERTLTYESIFNCIILSYLEEILWNVLQGWSPLRWFILMKLCKIICVHIRGTERKVDKIYIVRVFCLSIPHTITSKFKFKYVYVLSSARHVVTIMNWNNYFSQPQFSKLDSIWPNKRLLKIPSAFRSIGFYMIGSVMHAFWLVLTSDLVEDRLIDDVIIKTFDYIKQIDSKLPCVC